MQQFESSTTARPELLSRSEATVVAVKVNHTSALYEVWPLRVQIDYSVLTLPGQSSRKALLCYLEWLREEEEEEAVR